MSKRHRGDDVAPLTKAELRAHAHAERHRIKGELHSLAVTIGRSRHPDDCDEPAVAWKPMHHRDSQHALEKATRRQRLRHWKMKEWKRRTNARRAKVRQEEQLAKEL